MAPDSLRPVSLQPLATRRPMFGDVGNETAPFDISPGTVDKFAADD